MRAMRWESWIHKRRYARKRRRSGRSYGTFGITFGSTTRWNFKVLTIMELVEEVSLYALVSLYESWYKVRLRTLNQALTGRQLKG